MASARILVVEDNSTLQRLIGLLATRFGVEVDIVKDGQAALDALDRRQDYSMIFMDWLMPGMDGLECTKRIRRRESNSGQHIPIVGMTANATDEDRKQCLDSGMDDYLVKPFKVEQFGQLLDRFLAPKDLAVSATRHH